MVFTDHTHLFVPVLNKLPDKKSYLNIGLLISQPKHMLLAFEEDGFFYHPKHVLRKQSHFTLKSVVLLTDMLTI